MKSWDLTVQSPEILKEYRERAERKKGSNRNVDNCIWSQENETESEDNIEEERPGHRVIGAKETQGFEEALER